MKSIVKNIVALIVGVIVGSLVNISLVNLGPLVISLPEGADVSTIENLQSSMSLFTPANFILPFLAHALGTLVGAFVAARFAASHPKVFALVVGVFFLIGGIMAVRMLGGPMWFNAADLLLAYIPMGCLGAALADRTRSKEA